MQIDEKVTNERLAELTGYEMQVLIGTSISGCNMAPDRVFDLPAAWARLHALGLIDRTDGLAIITPKGAARINALRTQPNTVIEAGEWQDISTAPKNRTPLLLLSPEGDVGIGYLENTGYDDLKFVSGSAAWCGTRPYDRAAAVWLGGIRAEDATHWMPLPEPPEPSP